MHNAYGVNNACTIWTVIEGQHKYVFFALFKMKQLIIVIKVEFIVEMKMNGTADTKNSLKTEGFL